MTKRLVRPEGDEERKSSVAELSDMVSSAIFGGDRKTDEDDEDKKKDDSDDEET